MKFRDSFIEGIYETARTILEDLDIDGSANHNKKYTKYDYPITFGGPGFRMSLVIETPEKDILIRYRKGHASRSNLGYFESTLKMIRTPGRGDMIVNPNKANKVHGVFLAKSFYNQSKWTIEDIRKSTGIDLVVGKTEEEIIENFGKRLTEILAE